MEQSTMEKYKVIGHCSKMQTLSLDQEINLWDGIPYRINFFQDFSKLYLDNHPLEDIPVATLIKAIYIPANEPAFLPERNLPQVTNNWNRNNGDFWVDIERAQAEERKRGKKWRKKHPKPKNQKEAMKKYERIMDDIMKG